MTDENGNLPEDVTNPVASEPTPMAPLNSGAQQPVEAPTTNMLSIVSLVSGVASFLVLPFVGAVVGVVTGHIALSQLKRKPEQGHGMAVAGLVISYLNVALSILLAVVFIVIGVAAYNGVSKQLQDNQTNSTQCLQQAGNDPAAVQKCLEKMSDNMNKLNDH